MPKKSNTRRERIAREAARIIAEEELSDYLKARAKAAAHLGSRGRHDLPSGDEIEEALIQYRELFQGNRHKTNLKKLRTLALEAMQAFESFSPRLVGPILSGAAEMQDPIQLHLFSATPEEIIFRLMEMKIPWRESNRKFQQRPGRLQIHPAFLFQADDIDIELVWFPTEGIRQAPLNPLTQHPERRASASEIERMLR